MKVHIFRFMCSAEFMEQSPSSEDNSRAANEEIPRLL